MASHDRDYMRDVPGMAGLIGSGEGRGLTLTFFALAGVNIAVFMAWSLGAHQLLGQHALLTRDALASGRVWTLLTAGFFHADIVHLTCTILALFVVRLVAASSLSPREVLGLYLLGTVCTGALGLVWPVAPLELPGAPTLPSSTDEVASGTAFFVDEHLLLTNAHVVQGAQEVGVELPGQPPLEGVVLERNRELDLALVAVEAKGHPLPLYGELAPDGRVVFAYGFGLLGEANETQLVTRGAISAYQESKRQLVFDAKVNPGNSGGPLVDAAGRWVGVVVAKSQGGPGVDSLGYAIEGQAAAAWVEGTGRRVQRTGGVAPPQGSEPPRDVRRAVARLSIRGGATSLTQTSSYAMAILLSPRTFGGSGGALALMAFLLVLEWRRYGFPQRGTGGCMLLGMGSIYLLLDATGKLRSFRLPGAGLDHGFHVMGVLVGVAAARFDLFARLARRRRGPRPRARPASKLDSETQARLDRILRIVGEDGIEALSADERAFLDETSRRLAE